jgi:TetR/AcrR family transcriptional repressor of nem operon
MSNRATKSTAKSDTKRRLVEAAIRLILARGFTATGVDAICAEAGVTKGAFFHYFKSKEDIGCAALAAWGEFGMSIYKAARDERDPLAQLHRLLDIMEDLAARPGDPLACVVGMTAQEMAAASPALRMACHREFAAWVEFVGGILADAKRAHPPRVDFNPEEVAWMLHGLWQGSMLIAKTRPDQTIVTRNLRHARAYVDSLFSGTVLPGARSPRLTRQPSPSKKP